MYVIVLYCFRSWFLLNCSEVTCRFWLPHIHNSLFLRLILVLLHPSISPYRKTQIIDYKFLWKKVCDIISLVTDMHWHANNLLGEINIDNLRRLSSEISVYLLFSSSQNLIFLLMVSLTMNNVALFSTFIFWPWKLIFDKFLHI